MSRWTLDKLSRGYHQSLTQRGKCSGFFGWRWKMMLTGGEEAATIFGIVWGSHSLHAEDRFQYVRKPLGNAVKSSMSALKLMQLCIWVREHHGTSGSEIYLRQKCFWHTTQIKLNNLAIDIFRVKLSFHIIIIMGILQGFTLNTWSFLQSKLHFAVKIHCTDCHSNMSHLLQSVAKEARKPSLHILEGDV